MTRNVRHLIMLDGRSLCDRIAPAALLDSLTLSEIDAIPACGSCIAAFHVLRVDLAVVLGGAPSVSPPTTELALADLRGTRWQTGTDIDAAISVYGGLDLQEALTMRLPARALAPHVRASRERRERAEGKRASQ